MLICAECFKDEELRKEVLNEGAAGICDVCGNKGIVLDLSHFFDFFKDIFRLYKKCVESQLTILEIIQNTWSLFSKVEYGEKILNEVLMTFNPGYSLSDMVGYAGFLQDRIDIWKNTKKQLREQYRFFVNHDEFERNNYIEIAITIKKGTKLYRARVTDSGMSKFPSNKMGCPPKDKTKAGRANPIGIPYLYLCRDINTTLYEVRAGFLDKVSVGFFKVLRDLKLVDFDFGFPFYPSYVDDGFDQWCNKIVKYEVLKEIRKDLSKPLTRYDTELEYVPTQWICEYCKMIGADGISFASSLDKDGVNYVIFNQSDAKCTRVLCRTIEEVNIIAK